MFNPEERLFFKTAVMELFGFMNLRHFCHTEDVKNNRPPGLNILLPTRFGVQTALVPNFHNCHVHFAYLPT